MGGEEVIVRGNNMLRNPAGTVGKSWCFNIPETER